MKKQYKHEPTTALAFIAFTAVTLLAAWRVYYGPSWRINWINLGLGILGMVITARQLFVLRRDAPRQ